MSLHVDLRLTVAVFGAALCPPWTALGVLQVGLVGSVIRYSGESHWTNDKWSSTIYILINENLIICSIYVYSLFMHIWQNMLNWFCFQTKIWDYWHSNLYGAAGQLPSPVPGIKSFCWMNEFVNDNKNSCCSEWKYTVPAPRRPPAITLNKHKNAI